MRGVTYSNTIENLKYISFVLALLIVTSPPALAEKFTAGHVIEKMGRSDRYSFVAGVVEGLAYARFVADGKKTEGMACIYKWFYRDKTAWPQILQTFIKFKTHTPGAVLGALIKKKCGS